MMERRISNDRLGLNYMHRHITGQSGSWQTDNNKKGMRFWRTPLQGSLQAYRNLLGILSLKLYFTTIFLLLITYTPRGSLSSERKPLPTSLPSMV